jgi:hypothetical protein
MARNLKVGERVRAKVRTVCGWKGSGTVLEPPGRILMDDTATCDYERRLLGYRIADFCDYELARYNGPPIVSPFPKSFFKPRK